MNLDNQGSTAFINQMWASNAKGELNANICLPYGNLEEF